MGNIYKVQLYEFIEHEDWNQYEYRTHYQPVCTILVQKGMFNRCEELSTKWSFSIYRKKYRLVGDGISCSFPMNYSFDNPKDRYLVLEKDFTPLNLASNNDVLSYGIDILDTRWSEIYEETLKPSSSKGKREARQLVRKMYK